MWAVSGSFDSVTRDNTASDFAQDDGSYRYWNKDG